MRACGCATQKEDKSLEWMESGNEARVDGVWE